MRKFNIVLLVSMGISFCSIVGCSKSNSNSKGGSAAAADTVLYSDWIPLHLVVVGVVSDSDYEQKIAAPALTAAALSKGLILVYANEAGSGGKYVNYVSDFGIYPTFTPDTIYMDAYGTFGYQISLNTVVDSVRYVIVPGTVSTNGVSGPLQTRGQAGFLRMDYGTLIKTLNIPAHGPAAPSNSSILAGVHRQIIPHGAFNSSIP